MTRAYWYSVSVSWITLPLLGRLDGADREREQRGDAERDERTSGAPSPSAATIASASAKTRNVRWVPTSGISSSAERNVPSSEPTVEIAYMRPAVSPESSMLSSFSRIAHGETAPSISTGIATSAEHAEQRAEAGAEREVVERVDAEREERLRDDRDEREQHGGDEHQQAQRAQVGAAVGHPAAEPVADRQRDEHDRDRVRPHDRRGAEERRHQARGSDLGAQGRAADDEDEQLERREPARPRRAGVHLRLSPRRG